MVPSRFSLSGTALKRLALVSMLLDHLGASLLEAGRFTSAVPPAETLFRQMEKPDFGASRSQITTKVIERGSTMKK